MSASQPLEASLLKLFAAARDHRLAATNLKAKLASSAGQGGAAHDPEAVDRAIAALIDDGRLAVTGGGKAGHHPRPKGSYRLTGAGKDHVRPQRPDASDDIIEFQRAYLLLQFLRVKGENAASMTRSELNGKLNTKSARESAEFDPKDKGIIDYHLDRLVSDGSLDEKRVGVSTRYTLTDDGRRALGSANQHDTVSFTFTGAALNALLEAARESSTAGSPRGAESTDREAVRAAPEPEHHAASPASEVRPRHIHDLVAQLKADRYAGKSLIPIHEVRRLVAQDHGDHAASHPVFDRLLMSMRGDGELEIIAIADSRDTPEQHLEDSIPGRNETLFFIDTE